MEMTMKKIIISCLFSIATVYTFGQEFCYYVFDEKICPDISTTQMLVKPETPDMNDLTDALQNTVAGSLKNIEPLSDGVFLVEMGNTSKENIIELIRQWHFREDVLSASPVFMDEYGEIAGGYTNKVVVWLKSNDDYPVLQQCAEAYHIIEIELNEFDAVKYMLTLPRNSEKNSLEIANELYETGLFANTTPEFIIFVYFDNGNSNPSLPDQEDRSPFTVYPNPASDLLYIETNGQICELHIYGIHGAKALQTVTNGNKAEINVSALQNGIYFLHLRDIPDGKQEIRKIIIKH
jgi:hypothetical protein